MIGCLEQSVVINYLAVQACHPIVDVAHDGINCDLISASASDRLGAPGQEQGRGHPQCVDWRTKLGALILIGSISLFLFNVSRIRQSDATVLPQAGVLANVEAQTASTEPATRLVAMEHCRKLLLALKQDGCTADVVLMRPLTWLNE